MCIRDSGYTAVPVLDQGDKYVGCVTEGDFLRHIIDVGATEMRAQEKYTLKTILRQDFCPPLPITCLLYTSLCQFNKMGCILG